LKNLTGLYVWENRLGSLPECLSKMTGLLYLRVNRNYLKTFPQGMKNLSLLEEIDISHNYFESLPESIYGYSNLKILAVVNNPWNDQTWKILQEKADELRSREVSVHLSEKD
jgi:internalin A